MTIAPLAIPGHPNSYDIQIADTLPLVEACVSDLCSCPAGIHFGLRVKPRIDPGTAQVEVDARCTCNLQPCVAVDLEGVRLSRMGKVSLVQLKANHSRKVWLVDFTVLGKEAFTHTNEEGASLKAVLESPAYKKLFYDVRRDADALYNLYNITLQNVLDVQLLELSVRISNHIHSCHLNGFAKAISLYLQPQSPSPFLWTKELGKALMQPHALVRAAMMSVMTGVV
ncbi:hypothetical protein FA13DRAFT_1794247 [Coprinellus micaceus]|uniref:3'-5' exonuclease domain-containing protein n=1 Tax=Coprinellus micaceus TaxID=71717 RepID=A0A4Y7T1F1_COPMI|nr:hypothetical protein FA13DRAFT_1794247 [Coprinellus micaceus]